LYYQINPQIVQALMRLIDTAWALKNPLKLYAVRVCEIY
jgi:hypothetical protein